MIAKEHCSCSWKRPVPPGISFIAVFFTCIEQTNNCEFLKIAFGLMLQLMLVGGREFNKLLEAGALLYQLMGNARGGWTTNRKMSKKLCIQTFILINKKKH